MNIDLSALTDDGDTLDLGDGRTLRLKVKPDLGYSVNEDDFYGAFKWPDGRTNGFGYERRPAGFDGNAEKLDARQGPIWWQPPAEGPKRGTPEFNELRDRAMYLLDVGYVVVYLEVLNGLDGYGRPIVTKVARVGGIEPDADMSEVVSELAAELEL